MLDDDLISTNAYDDPDPDGTDVYGMIPLLAEVEPDDEDEDDRDDSDDNSGADDDELSPEISASSLEVDVPEGTTFEDDDDAFQALTARGATDMFPGEAHALIKYMRPLTPEEQDIADDPFLNDLRWTDDPAHVDDVLKAGKGDDGLDKFLDDATYGDIHMKTPEEIAERRFGNDKDIRQVALPPRRLPPGARQKILKATNASVVVGLSKKLTVEHANWLAEQDKAASVAVRPRAYYENVAQLWTGKQLRDARIPTTASGNWFARPKKFVGAANAVLAATAQKRSRFSPVLGDQVDMGGWNPFSAAKSALKTAVKYTVTKPLQYSYKYGKMAVTKPFVYTYKGVKYVGDKAKQLALAPLKAIIHRYTGKMINRRANALAKQKGLSAPTAVEKADAASWAKNFVRSKGGKYGGAIASLMGSARACGSTLGSAKTCGSTLGSENPRDPGYGMREVDISFGSGDLMGLSKASTAGLIILGPIGLIAILTGLVKTSEGSGAPPPAPGTPEAAAEGTDPGADDGSADPGAGDPGAGNPGDGSADPGAAPDDGSADSSGTKDNLGRGKPRGKPTYGRHQAGYTYTPTGWHKDRSLGVSLEQLNSMPPRKRALAQKLISSGRIRLA